MTTFSQLVDEMVAEHKRPDLKAEVTAFLNQTIREMHSDPASNGPVYFDQNRVEFSLTATPLDDNGNFQWAIPDTNRLQIIESVYFSGPGKYAQLVSPSNARLESDSDVGRLWSYYRSGEYLVFSGFGGDSMPILVSAHYYPRSLRFILKPADRWAIYNDDDSWTFRQGTGKTEEELLDLSTNWIIRKWPETLKEGIRAKVFKRLGDEIRQRTSYSSYQSTRSDMQVQESVNLRNHYVK